MFWNKSIVPVLSISLICLIPASDATYRLLRKPLEIIRNHGYPAEEHRVTTPDGYQLTMHRIPHGKNVNCSMELSCEPRIPVFIQHGLLSSSMDFLVGGPNNALPFVLADQGYDVWMGNNRGNPFSRKHLFMEPSQPGFWKFSWHETGAIDVPTMIDHVLSSTKRKALHFIGHGQGTTSFLVMGADRPEYNHKILGAHLLSPTSIISTIKSPFIRILSRITNLGGRIFTILGSGELLPNKSVLKMAGQAICNSHCLTKRLCSKMLFLITGYDSNQMDPNLINEIDDSPHFGWSIRMLFHSLQSAMSKRFCKYDHGLLGNFNHYGRMDPPDYDLNNITTPMYLYKSSNDWLVDPEGVKKIAELPSVKFDHQMPEPKWISGDFLWAKGVKSRVYDMVVKNMRRCEHEAKVENRSLPEEEAEGKEEVETSSPAETEAEELTEIK